MILYRKNKYKYKLVNKLKEVVNRLIENEFRPIETDLHPKTLAKLIRIKVYAYSLGWGRLIYVRKGKVYPTPFLKEVVKLRLIKQKEGNKKNRKGGKNENEHKTSHSN